MFCLLLRSSKNAIKAIVMRPRTPPTTPPTMAPVLLLLDASPPDELLVGLEGGAVTVTDTVLEVTIIGVVLELVIAEDSGPDCCEAIIALKTPATVKS